SYLSKLVNAHKGKSFTAYITDLRVNYAIRRLKEDRKFRSYTIDSIARDIGFNRSESFSRAFKNKTGLYPSYYIKRLDSQNIE
ncbi:MAG: helix-turn-helix domain-containing protein, partial [Bacteroidota bacterium]